MPITTRSQSRQRHQGILRRGHQNYPNNSSTTNNSQVSDSLVDVTSDECRFSISNASQTDLPPPPQINLTSLYDGGYYRRVSTILSHTPSQESIQAIYRGHVSAVEQNPAIQTLTSYLDKRSKSPKTDYTYARSAGYTGNYNDPHTQSIDLPDADMQPNMNRRPISPSGGRGDYFSKNLSQQYRHDITSISSNAERRHHSRMMNGSTSNAARQIVRDSGNQTGPQSNNPSLAQRFTRYFIVNKDVRHHHHHHYMDSPQQSSTTTVVVPDSTVPETPDEEAINNSVVTQRKVQRSHHYQPPAPAVFSDDENDNEGQSRTTPVDATTTTLPNGGTAHKKSRTTTSSSFVVQSPVISVPYNLRSRSRNVSQLLQQHESSSLTNQTTQHDMLETSISSKSREFIAFACSFVFLYFLVLPIKSLVVLVSSFACFIRRVAAQSASHVFGRQPIARAHRSSNSRGQQQQQQSSRFVENNTSTVVESETEVETVVHHYPPNNAPEENNRAERAKVFGLPWWAFLLLLLLLPLILYGLRFNDAVLYDKSTAAVADIVKYCCNIPARVYDCLPSASLSSLLLRMHGTKTVPTKADVKFTAPPPPVGSKTYNIVHNNTYIKAESLGADGTNPAFDAAAINLETQRLIAAVRDELLEKMQSNLDAFKSQLDAERHTDNVKWTHHEQQLNNKLHAENAHRTDIEQNRDSLDAERARQLNDRLVRLEEVISTFRDRIDENERNHTSSLQAYISELFMLHKPDNKCCLRLEAELTELRARLHELHSTIAEHQRNAAATADDVDKRNSLHRSSTLDSYSKQLLENITATNAKQMQNFTARFDALQQHVVTLLTSFEGRLEHIVKEIHNVKITDTRKRPDIFLPNDADDTFVSRYVDEALKLYDSDKTGKPDFALESSGGEVLSIRCTTPWRNSVAVTKIWGIPVWWQAQGDARSAIQRDMAPGNCFAFQGFPGTLVVKLASYVRPTSVSIEHIHRENSPTGNIDSAPKDFEVYALRGLADLEHPQLLLRGQFDANDGSPSLQIFPVTEELTTASAYNMVEIKILSNHGSPSHTCLYRLRVHGVKQPQPA